jgi:hypothetical protein
VSSADARLPATDLTLSAARPRVAQSAVESRPSCGAFIPAPTDPSENVRKPVRSAHNAAHGHSWPTSRPPQTQYLPRNRTTTKATPSERTALPMHDETITDPVRVFNMVQRDVLYYLTNPDDCQSLWSVEDLGRALDNPVGAVDAVGELRRAGLIHQTSDGYVFATRAGVRIVQIVGRVV